MSEEERKIVENTYTDPVTGKFKVGNPGKPLGAKSFTTDFDEVVSEIAATNNITQSEARKILLKKAYIEAKDGNFNFYKDIADRYYGKAQDNVDITSKGEKIESINYLVPDGNTTNPPHK